MTESLSKSGLVTKKGFAHAKLIIVIVTLGVFATLAVRASPGIMRTAYKSAIERDLYDFVKAEDLYFLFYGQYFGTTGDYIQQGDQLSGGLVTPKMPFVPSRDVRVEVTSTKEGDPKHFMVKVSHAKLDIACEYDFATRQKMEREN